MKPILNLTQHAATPDQVAAGVIDLPEDLKSRLVAALTFDELPTPDDLAYHAGAVTGIVNDWRRQTRTTGRVNVMVEGAPFFGTTLETYLQENECNVLYAFSRRESVETVQPDGSVKKVQVFRHVGFVDPMADTLDRAENPL